MLTYGARAAVNDNPRKVGSKYDELCALHRHPERCKIVLRRTIAGCIGFHCDGSYATNTVQVTLNDDYTGGELMFFTDGKMLGAPPFSIPPTRIRRPILTVPRLPDCFILTRIGLQCPTGLPGP